MCNYNQTSPDSHFTQKRICSIAWPNGRVTLSDMRLIETSGNEKSERLISDEAEYAVILLKEFGIIL
jgi:N-hydroxyarylamine O-acetyltransferase